MVKKVETKKKADEENASDTDKVFDISRPGESMPSATSRPLIVSRKTTSDPMVSPVSTKKDDNTEDSEEEQEADKSEGIIMSAPKKNRIEPLHTTISADEDNNEEKHEKSEEESTDKEPAQEDESKEIADTAAEVSTKKQTQNELAKQQEEADKKQADIDALIANKQFFVPINSVKKRRTTLYVLLFLSVVLILIIAVLVALDAGIIDLGISSPTDFIQDK